MEKYKVARSVVPIIPAFKGTSADELREEKLGQ
jgi:hypothetical protein